MSSFSETCIKMTPAISKLQKKYFQTELRKWLLMSELLMNMLLVQYSDYVATCNEEQKENELPWSYGNQ